MSLFFKAGISGQESCIGIIPVRLNSSRLPGKALLPIAGRAMVHVVYEAVASSGVLDAVLVATDHTSIFEYCVQNNIPVCMTSEKHNSGTDRVAEAALHFPNAQIVINFQGDEPFIKSAEIRDFVALMQRPEVSIATMACAITDSKYISDPSKVKVVFNHRDEALYFSRCAIPFFDAGKNADKIQEHAYWRHVGVYGFKMEVLQSLANLATCSLERFESLEQLRWLYYGYSIFVLKGEYEGFGIDTVADYEEALRRKSTNEC